MPDNPYSKPDLSFFHVMHDPLAFFCFKCYLATKQEQYKMEFIESCLQYRCILSDATRMTLYVRINRPS